MLARTISDLVTQDDPVEVVEPKGFGHPDTVCEALAETLSRNLCCEYRQRFGRILHHNVDKALLCGGRSSPAFGGGLVDAPFDIYLAGRATSQVGTDVIPVEEIAFEGSRSWLRSNLHAPDVDRHVRIHPLIRSGSQDLRDLFTAVVGRRSQMICRSEKAMLRRVHSKDFVLAVECHINGRDRRHEHPAWGEDVKVMGVHHGQSVHPTVACAIIDRHVSTPTITWRKNRRC